MADVTDPLRAAARLAKTAALKTEVVSAWWGTVASVSGDDITVVLDGDDLLQVQPVTVNATGPCLVGDEVLLQMQGRDLTIVANPTAQTRLLTDTGWLSIPAASGYTSTAQARRIGNVVYIRGAFTATSGTVATGTLGTLPSLCRPPQEMISTGNGAGSYIAKVAWRSTGEVACVGTPTGTTSYLGVSATSFVVT